MRHFSFICLLAALVWGLFLAWASLTDHPPQAATELASDKLLHLVAYLVLSLLIGFGFKNPRGGRGAWLVAACLAFIYGGILELLQPLVSESRVAEGGDMIANSIGILVGCSVGLLANRRLVRRQDG